MYKLLRNILFWFDAEKVHYFSMNLFAFSCRSSIMRNIYQKKFCIDKTALERNCFGLVFSNPVGLAAGFDKNAKYLTELMEANQRPGDANYFKNLKNWSN